MTRVLIADDNTTNLYLLDSILKGNGFEVISAKNGAEALAAAKNALPDLIITDILMPVMDGFELCRRWKADEQLSRIPFIFYTATYTDPRDEQFAHSLGAERFIIKPQKPEVLIKEVREVLEEFATNTGEGPAPPKGNDRAILQEYNEVLFRKLEKKVLQLEEEITVRKAAEEQREAVIKELEQKNADLERFTYTVSHELKSPLITIHGFCGLLLKDASKGGDVELLRDHVRHITAAADTMNALLTDLLELSRVGRIACTPEKIGLGSIAQEAVDLLSGSLAKRGFVVEIEPGLPVVNVDHARIREVFINLIENALKFTGDRKDPVIRIGLHRDGQTPTFFFQDNGIGIEIRHTERVFNLFEKLDATSQGTGVGLTIVRRIVELHGGTIWVESDGAGKGTTFLFTLPGLEPTGT